MATSDGRFKRILSEEIEKATRDDGRTQTLVVLAEALQKEITTHPSHRNGQRVMHDGGGADYIMRGLIALFVANDKGVSQDDVEWILSNIERGLKSLKIDLNLSISARV